MIAKGHDGISRDYNRNLIGLMNAYNNNYRRAILLGGSRSGKTYSTIQWLVWYASQADGPKTVVVVRETAASFKTTLYTDFREILNAFNLDNPFANNKQVSQFKIFNTTVHLVGADDYTKIMGLKSDIVFINEYLSVSYDVYNQLALRCTEMLILDSNPISSVSRYYDLNELDDTLFLRTTYKDNPHLEAHIVKEIESYNPDSPINIQNKTADKWMHKVFALGEAMPRTGLIYPDVTWIDAMPLDLDFYGFGLDFGMLSHPTVLTVVGVKGNELYAQSLFYVPTPKVEMIHELIVKTASKYIQYGNNKVHIFADSANPLEISALSRLGRGIYKINAIKKPPGSVVGGIRLVNSYGLNIVRDINTVKEQSAYVWKEVGGIPLDEPKKANDDFWDSMRYAVLAFFRRK